MALTLTVRMAMDRKLGDLSEFIHIEGSNGKTIKLAVCKESKSKVRLIIDADKDFKINRRRIDNELTDKT